MQQGNVPEVEVSEIVDFWREAGGQRWFSHSDEFDDQCGQRFRAAHFRAARREFDAWMDTAEGALALLILLDQFPRNCFRGSAHAYATDPLARHFAEHAIAAGFDRQVDTCLRVFFHMPFEHSEDIADQHRAVEQCRMLDDSSYVKYAELHRDLIARFGRFPHRNAALGRETTVQEQSYLDSGGFSG